MKVSVVVIAKNEEKKIRECLKSAEWADEIVVLDDCSSDKTASIAKELTSSVYERKMDIEGKQRNHAYSLAKNEWVLSLDCDERITPELAKEIQGLEEDQAEKSAFGIPIKTFLGEEWVQYAGYYPARKVRLFRKSKFKYEEARVHPRIILDGKCGSLNGDILHYPYKNFFEVINKLNRETTLEAEKWVTDKRKMNALKAIRKALSRFLKFYFQKKGYKDGYLGFMFSLFHALYQIFTYAHYCDLKKKSV